MELTPTWYSILYGRPGLCPGRRCSWGRSGRTLSEGGPLSRLPPPPPCWNTSRGSLKPATATANTQHSWRANILLLLHMTDKFYFTVWWIFIISSYFLWFLAQFFFLRSSGKYCYPLFFWFVDVYLTSFLGPAEIRSGGPSRFERLPSDRLFFTRFINRHLETERLIPDQWILFTKILK